MCRHGTVLSVKLSGEVAPQRRGKTRRSGALLPKATPPYARLWTRASVIASCSFHERATLQGTGMAGPAPRRNLEPAVIRMPLVKRLTSVGNASALVIGRAILRQLDLQPKGEVELCVERDALTARSLPPRCLGRRARWSRCRPAGRAASSTCTRRTSCGPGAWAHSKPRRCARPGDATGVCDVVRRPSCEASCSVSVD